MKFKSTRVRHLNILRNRFEILIYQNITLASPLTLEKVLLNCTITNKEKNKPGNHYPSLTELERERKVFPMSTLETYSFLFIFLHL